MNIRIPCEYIYNYYGDESCHTTNDGNRYMALGTLCCRKSDSKKFSKEIQEIKTNYRLSRNFEIKSTKISIGGLAFYKELIKWFLQNPEIYFRVIIIDKNIIQYEDMNAYSTFYYKMYYNLFRYYMHGTANHIFLDYKDSRSCSRCAELEEFFSKDRMTRMKKITVQQINSKESNLIQMTDLLIGLVCYNANGKSANKAKCELIEQLKSGTNLDLFTTTQNAYKFDILNWRPKNEFNM